VRTPDSKHPVCTNLLFKNFSSGCSKIVINGVVIVIVVVVVVIVTSLSTHCMVFDENFVVHVSLMKGIAKMFMFL
jgi:hypothetical protein